ncbi:hypothetical protein [Cypionkella sp.]|jgi:hypothetical protein|uniref:hypothetical protein n=1 Tax=Cypionkella sp. TaxID=2811411 RepID=UPI002766282C|nr:hypothetical protein [Cypionkella sp.]
MPEFLPDLPVEGILECLKRSPGHEIRSGKFDSPESSAALVANAFGWFLNRPQVLPPLPGVPAGQAETVTLEAEMRYPWKGGRQPWLDVGIETATTLIGIQSKRYEPFRPSKVQGFSELIDRPEWRQTMGAYTKMRDDLVSGKVDFDAMDAVGLIKQAYGIQTRAEKRALGGVLVYLYAEPKTWASGKPVNPDRVVQHQKELAKFARMVAGDAVVFVPLRWADLLRQWAQVPALAAHVEALRARFGKLG